MCTYYITAADDLDAKKRVGSVHRVSDLDTGQPRPRTHVYAALDPAPASDHPDDGPAGALLAPIPAGLHTHITFQHRHWKYVPPGSPTGQMAITDDRGS